MRVFCAQRSVALLFALISCVPSPVGASEAAAWAALKQGAIVLFRHSNAPGGGDPPGMRIGDCSTQRNLDEKGRAQARRIGEAFRAQAVKVERVLTSQWCRSMETAELAFPGLKREEQAFNSFFSDRSKAPAQTEVARRILQEWRGPGALVVTTHHVNIGQLTGIFPASGEGVVVRISEGNMTVVGRIQP
jgi:phosphohistidine phosphatase SixA